MTTSTSTSTDRTLTPEEAVRLRRASDPRVSPDGRHVYFCAAPVSKEGEHPEGTIMRVPADGSAPPRPFTAGPGLDEAPRPSPDGSRLAFISDRHERGKPALYLMPTDGGEAERLVTERGEASDPRWSPDGARITFLLKDVDSEEDEKRKKEGRDDAIVVDDDKFTRLWCVDVAARAATRLSPDGMHVWAHAWSPVQDADGAGRVAFVQTPTPRLNDHIGRCTIGTITVDGTAGILPARAPASTGTAGILPASGVAGKTPANPGGSRPLSAGDVATICHVEGGVESLCWSPDGTRLAFVAPELQRPFTSSAAAPIVVPAAGGDRGGEPRAIVTGHPAQFSHVAWLSDDALVAAGIEGVRAAYYRVALDGDVSPYLPAGECMGGALRDLSLGDDRATLAAVVADTSSPGDVWVACPGEDLARLTTLNPDLEGMAWGSTERVSWHADDGLEIEGLLIKPVGYEAGTRYPTVVHAHGGPAWQWADGFYATWHDWGQFLAARGYAVLLPNPRGSTGRGTAYVAGNYDDVGGDEWRDILAGVHYLIGRGIADPNRLGIGGWSWGGYLTAWAVTQTDIFKGAVMGAGLSNLLSDHGQNDIPDANRLYFRALPYEDPAAYWDPSPITYAARVRTPTLILHGEKDERVTPAQAREFYRALKTLGVPTQFVLYPREPHSVAERAHQLDVLRRTLAWFDTYVKGVTSNR